MAEANSVILSPEKKLNKLCEITPTSLFVHGDLEYSDWERLLGFLTRGQAACQWAIGDALNYGHARYDRGQYDEACAATGYEKTTLHQFKRVAAKIESCTRVQHLSWKHHQLVAPLPAREQERWLARAIKGDGEKPWTVAQLRLALREASRKNELTAAPTKARLIRGNATDWLQQTGQCALLFTDPPYSTDIPNIDKFAYEWMPLALDTVQPDGRAFICIGPYPDELFAYLSVAKEWISENKGFVLANILVWTYRNTLGPKPKFDYKNNWQAILYFRGPDADEINCPEMNEQFAVQDIAAPDGRHGNRYHEWQKPDELAERLIRHSTIPGELVLDPFAGTGTFLLAAAKLGREAQGCETSEKMISIAKQRGCVADE